MDINQIEADLQSSDLQKKLKAVTELKNYQSEVAVPLLKSKMSDREFLVRSFVAMGLGKKQSADSFAALLEMVKFDRDPNVRAEASNSLSLFGKVATSHLVQVFIQDDHWLVRRSILAALIELNCPEELLEVCLCGIEGEDFAVREASVDGLGYLANTVKQEVALQELLKLVEAPQWRIRVVVAKALIKFNLQSAKNALIKLKQDPDSRVVGAALEGFI